MVHIRRERPGDIAAIREVVDAAFGQPVEGRLVDTLRARGDVTLSLVALRGETVVGHILFHPLEIHARHDRASAIGLAPLSVHPDLQQRGVGSQLARVGLATCRALGHGRVLVLGDPAYYRRFGFVPAIRYGIKDPFGLKDHRPFMARPLARGAFAGVRGLAEYPTAFKELES